MEPQTPAPQEPQTPEQQPAVAPEQPMSVMETPTPVIEAPVEQTVPAAAVPVAPTVAVAVNPGHSLGIAGLVLAFIAPLIGFILSIVALNKSKKVSMKNGVALAGVIISSISLVIWLIFGTILVIAAVKVAQQCSDLGPGTHFVDGVTYTCS